MEKRYEESELIINSDGSVFHLHLKPEQLADKVILVGDPGRVDMVGDFFSKINHRVSNREFYTLTGLCRGEEISVISTGIGTDNIDIVINELDALVNIDLKSRTDKVQKSSLTIFRIGTSGAIQEDIRLGTFLASKYAVGFDGLLNFYEGRDRVCEASFEKAFVEQTGWNYRLPAPYFCKGSARILEAFGNKLSKGITISANGFYGPQGRSLRAGLAFPELNRKLADFRYRDERITNFEMEGSAIYGLSEILGHQALTVCLVIANRERKEFLEDYKPHMRNLVDLCLEEIVKLSD